VVLPADYARQVELVFHDGGWARVMAVIPSALDERAERSLRAAVSANCDAFLSAVRLLEEGAATAAAVRKPAGKQPSPLESLHKHLKAASAAWTEVKGMHDDRLGILSDLGDQLGSMASDAERRLTKFRRMKANKPAAAAATFIRSVARSCHAVGLIPITNGRVYEDNSPTWFQEFIAQLNDNFLGARGWGAPGSYTRNALFAEVTKVMSGDRK
jgi:hypothetical protein